MSIKRKRTLEVEKRTFNVNWETDFFIVETANLTTKRGQHHKYKSFVIVLIKDIGITKIDTNVRRNHRESFEEKNVQFEKRNADPLYFHQTICQQFPLLNDGVEFSLWRLSKDNTNLIPLPPGINNAPSLCSFDELNRSKLYIRLQALPPSSSSAHPHQVLDSMDFDEKHADEPSAPQGTNALHQNVDEMLGMPTKENSSMDGGNAHSLCVPKKRKIVSESGQEIVEAKHQLISSAHHNHPLKEPIIVFRDDDMTKFSTTIEGGFVSSTGNLYQETSVSPDTDVLSMVGNNSAVSGQFTQLLDDRGPSSFLDNFNNYGYIFQPQPIIEHPGFVDSGSSYIPTPDSAMLRLYPPQRVNETWCSDQGSIAMPDPLHKPHLSNFTDSVRLPEPVQNTGQQQSGLNLTSLSTQHQFDSPVLQTLQSTSELAMSSKDTTNSENSYVSQENASNGSVLHHAQKLGKIQVDLGKDITGIAALNGKVYIACEDTDTLLTYSSTGPFKKQAEVKVDGMKHPQCIAACAEMNCLFISDGASVSSNCVWMVKDGGEAVCKKPMEGVECSSLSVTRNGELLIVDSKHKCIHLYNSDGCCFCCVKLPDEIECPKPPFVVKSLGDSFYVSSAWTMICDKRETILSMVYKVSVDGDIVKTYGGRAGRGSGQLSGSNVTLAVDKYGRVIVCDGGNQRVLMLDSNLKLLTTVVVLDNCDFLNHRDYIFYMDTNADLIFQLSSFGWERYINIWSLSQFQPNLMPDSSSSISSKAISGAAEFHLLCSIDNKEILGMDMFSLSWSIKNKEMKRKIVRGVATLTDSIYVLTERDIVVFDCRNPYKRKYKENIGYDLCDIAANVTNGRLYVTDRRIKCVWSMGIDLRRKTWLEGIGSPYTLSVAKDGSVLILSNKDQNLGIYKKHGLHQKVTVSHSRKLHLRHAIQLSDTRGKETYLICHGHGMNQDDIDDYDYMYDSDFLSNEVFIVSANGDTLLAFGGRFGNEADQLNVPSYMGLDRDGTILVADCKNNRVLRLNHQLKRQNISLSKDVQGIEEPLRLCLSKNTGQIIIANSNSLDIFVHDNVLRCQDQAEHSSPNPFANTDAYESETPDVQLIGQIDSQLPKNEPCIGAAVLQDQIYLIYYYVKAVYVHSSVPPYNLLSKVGVENMEDLSHIAASDEHNCVYIAGKHKVWRLLINGEQCETFLDDIDVMSISVTEKGHLLVMVFPDLHRVSFLGTYNADGICIQVIALGEEFYLYVQHAVQLGAKKILVSCFVEKFESCAALKEVSHNGAILHTYGPYFDEYFECGGMTAGEGDQIFVIDKTNGGRVLVFGSGARLLGILVGNKDHRVREITGLCYIKDKMQLIVIESDHIDIYQLKNREPQMDDHGRNVNNPLVCSRQGNSDQLLWARMDFDHRTLRALQQLRGKLYLLYSTYLEVIPRQNLVDKAELQNGALMILMDRSCNSGDDDDGLWDIAASEIDFCLYVTDRYHHCVWSVNIDHKREKCVTGIGSPYTLSVTEEGHLCILSNTYKSLNIYDRSGKSKNSIPLPRFMKYLLHAVQTPRGTFIISWTWKSQKVISDGARRNGNEFVKINANKDQRNQNDSTDDDDDDEAEKKAANNLFDIEDVVFEERRQRSGDSETPEPGLVCEVSSDGSVLRSFSTDDSKPNQNNISDSRCFLRLDKPCHLAVDNDGRVFVADYYRSGRVLLLDSQLKFVTNLTEKYPLQGYKAKRLCYDKNRKELIVFHHQKDDDVYYSSLICIRL